MLKLLLLLLLSVPLYANPRFHDATQEAGLDFVHVNGANGQKFVIETVGPGGGLFDYDGDGRLDIYLINGAAVPGTEYDPAPQNALYHNRDNGTFADVTGHAGVGDMGYGMGCAVGDIDNDGDLDLYVTNFGATVLYRNEGDGIFADITTAAGLGSAEGKELGVVFGDVDLDGDPDLYLANDKTLNFLYLNDGTGHFADEALLAGVAYNEDGDVEAGMGVDMGDYDNDGDPDLFVTNFQWETNTLYKNLGDGTFVDETFLAGLGKGSIAYLAWGTRFFDVDNDGDRDLFIANGHLESDVEQYENATFPPPNPNGLSLFYEEHKLRYTAPAEVEVRRLLARDEAEGTAIVERMRAGRDTTELVDRFVSVIYGSGALEGENPVSRALRADEGTFHGPFATDNGYIVLQVLRRRPDRLPPLDEIRERVEVDWATAQLQAAVKELAASLRHRRANEIRFSPDAVALALTSHGK